MIQKFRNLAVVLAVVLATGFPMKTAKATGTPVIDISAIATAIANTFETLAQAAEHTEKFRNIIAAGEKTWAAVEAVRDITNTVHDGIRTAQELAEIYNYYARVVNNVIDGIQFVSSERRNLPGGSKGDFQYALSLIDFYSRTLNDASKVFLQTTRYLDAAKTQMNQYQREMEFRRLLKELGDIEAVLDVANERLLAYLLQKEYIQYIMAVRQGRAMLSRDMNDIHISDFSEFLASGFGVIQFVDRVTVAMEEKQGVMPEEVDVKPIPIGPYRQIFFAISAIVLLFGAYKVFERIQLGEDIYKSIAVWFLASLFCLLVGVAAGWFA
jgi:hypothetical protein